MGNGKIRAKAWPKGDEEPDEWTLEIEHADAHTHGALGFMRCHRKVKKKVYIDNISITQN